MATKMPIIASTNLREYEVNNSDQYTIKSICVDSVKIGEHTIPIMDKFRKSFIPAYAVTVYKLYKAAR